MYRETLKNQWRNLYCDFESEYDTIAMQGEKPDCFNRWYEARSHRWNSVSYAEGIILDQENKPEFAQALREAIKRFQFQKEEPGQEKNVPAYCGIGAVAGVLVGVGAVLFQTGVLKAVISGVVVSAIAIPALLRYTSEYNESVAKREKQAYVEQLKDYANELDKICERYGVL